MSARGRDPATARTRRIRSRALTRRCAPPSTAGGRGAGEAKRRVAQEKAGSMAGFLLLLRRALFLQLLLRFLLLFLLLVQVCGHDGLRWLVGRCRAKDRRPGAAHDGLTPAPPI